MNINIKTYVVVFILIFALSACKTTSGTKWIEIDQEPLAENEKSEFIIIVEKKIVQKMSAIHFPSRNCLQKKFQN